MSTEKPDIARMQAAFTSSLQEHWVFFVVEGIVLMLLGALAIFVPPVATLAIAIFIGWLILLSGVLGLIMTLRTRAAPGFGWSLLSAVVGIVAGAVLLLWPLSGAFSLTVILTVFLLLEGIASIMYALQHRQQQSSRWWWMLLSGVVDIGLAAMIFAGLPSSAAWAIGLLVGINLVFGGSALIAMALQARSSAPAR